MTRRILAAMALALLTAACSSTPDSSAVATTDASVADRAGLSRSDVVFDNDLNGGGAPTGAAVPGSQDDLNVQAGDRVLFAYDSSSVTAEGRATLERQAAWANQYPNVTLLIEGHCDERGTREYNLALGERRAQAVKNYLVSLGVSAGRISTISYGKERPAVLGSSEADHAQNRRGVTIVQ